jgi:hypothetical protein
MITARCQGVREEVIATEQALPFEELFPDHAPILDSASKQVFSALSVPKLQFKLVAGAYAPGKR